MRVECVPMDDRHGRDVLLVVAKMTWSVDTQGRVLLADPPAPIRLGAEPWPAYVLPHEGAGRRSEWPATERYPSDLVDEKPGTDVLLVGTARPPVGGNLTELDVQLRVLGRELLIDKRLKVYGPRVWHAGLVGIVPGPAGQVVPTELRWESTYGGTDLAVPAKPWVEERNPVGQGHVRDRTTLLGVPAPAIEDPRAPLSSRKPAPGGFGPLGTSWHPRGSRVGTYDESWRHERAPVRPTDFDPRFNCAAPDDQWCSTPLGGGEAIEVLGTEPAGAWRFRLPTYAPRFRTCVLDEERDCETHLDTFLIDADEHRVELVWRVCVPLPRKTELLRWVRVSGSEALPDALTQELFSRARGTPEAS